MSNEIKLRDDFRLGGYYPRVTREGDLIESDERNERLGIISMTILGILGCIAIIGIVVILETRRDYEYKTRIAELEAIVKIQSTQKPVLNVRKLLGLEK